MDVFLTTTVIAALVTSLTSLGLAMANRRSVRRLERDRARLARDEGRQGSLSSLLRDVRDAEAPSPANLAEAVRTGDTAVLGDFGLAVDASYVRIRELVRSASYHLRGAPRGRIDAQEQQISALTAQIQTSALKNDLSVESDAQKDALLLVQKRLVEMLLYVELCKEVITAELNFITDELYD